MQLSEIFVPLQTVRTLVMEFDKPYSIVCKGLADGAHEFVFSVGNDFFAAADNDELRGGLCTVNVNLRKTANNMTLDTHIEGTVVTACDRCLEDCTVTVRFDGSLNVRIADQTVEYDGDTMWISPAEDELDLGHYIYESIVLALPYRRVHPDGECNAEMMARFRIATPEEFDRMEAEVEKSQAHGLDGRDMEKLAALKAQMERNDAKKER